MGSLKAKAQMKVIVKPSDLHDLIDEKFDQTSIGGSDTASLYPYGKRFKRKREKLKEHNSPIECDVCFKTCLGKTQLFSHRRTHRRNKNGSSYSCGWGCCSIVCQFRNVVKLF